MRLKGCMCVEGFPPAPPPLWTCCCVHNVYAYVPILIMTQKCTECPA